MGSTFNYSQLLSISSKLISLFSHKKRRTCICGMQYGSDLTSWLVAICSNRVFWKAVLFTAWNLSTFVEHCIGLISVKFNLYSWTYISALWCDYCVLLIIKIGIFVTFLIAGTKYTMSGKPWRLEHSVAIAVWIHDYILLAKVEIVGAGEAGQWLKALASLVGDHILTPTSHIEFHNHL